VKEVVFMAPREKVYPVRDILCRVYVKSQDRFFFKTEWEEKEADGTNVVSDEPIENFRDTPTPIFEFGKRERTEDEVNKQWLTRRVCKAEYIPTGDEFIRKVYNVFSTKVRRNSEEFYYVRFFGDKKTHMVRLLFMEYYFPRELLLFWIENKIKGPNFVTDK
jgi:hypothetical protein